MHFLCIEQFPYTLGTLSWVGHHLPTDEKTEVQRNQLIVLQTSVFGSCPVSFHPSCEFLESNV
jgi:hypothetical protein